MNHLILLLIALQIFDVLSTLSILRLGGSEAWAPARWMMERFGSAAGLVLLKLGAALVVWALLSIASPTDYWLGLLGLIATYLFVAANNTYWTVRLWREY